MGRYSTHGRALGWLASLVVFATVSAGLASEVVDFDVTYTHGGEAKLVHVSGWAPEDVPVRGLLYLCPGTNGDMRDRVGLANYQAAARALGFAIIGLEDRDGTDSHFHGVDADEARDNIEAMLETAASKLDCSQLVNAPIAFHGFSKGGATVNLLASYMPERTIGFVTDKSSRWPYLTADDVPTDVPGLFVGGSKDHIGTPDLVDDGFVTWRIDGGGQVALAVDWQWEDRTHRQTQLQPLAAFLAQCIARRYPGRDVPSAVSGHPVTLQKIDPDAGWLVAANEVYQDPEGPSYTDGYVYEWLRCPATASVASGVSVGDRPGWVVSQAMAMVLRSHSAAREQTGIKPVNLSSTTPPQPDLSYPVGQAIDLLVTNTWLDLDNISGVQIYHEDELIGEFPSLPADGASVAYTLTEPGVHTFWTEVTYTYLGEETSAGDYFLAFCPGSPGDADGNGYVDDDDLSLLLTHWLTETDWVHGEFSGAAPVDDDDLSLLLSNWTGTPPAGTTVPEPAGLALLLSGILGVRRRRRV